MATIRFFANNPEYAYGDENYPNFDSYADLKNYIGPLTNNGPYFKSNLNWIDETHAEITIIASDLQTSNNFNIFNCNHLVVEPDQTTFNQTEKYFWITSYSVNTHDAGGLILKLEIDMWLTYWWRFKQYILNEAFVENRHCNRWFYDKLNKDIRPTWYGALTNYAGTTPTFLNGVLQYLNNENIVGQNENWITTNIIQNSYSYQWFSLFTFAYGNIVQIAGGKKDDDGGNYDHLRLNFGIINKSKTPSPTSFNKAFKLIPKAYFGDIYNPQFLTLLPANTIAQYNNLEDATILPRDGIWEFYDLYTNAKVPIDTQSQMGFDPTYYGPENGYDINASPYLIYHGHVLLPQPLKVGVKISQKQPTEFNQLKTSMDNLYMNFPNDGNSASDNSQQWNNFVNNIRYTIFGYNSLNSSGYWYGLQTGYNFSSGNTGELPKVFVTSNGSKTSSPNISTLPFTFANEFNRWSQFNKNKLSTSNTYILIPQNKKTSFNFGYDTKLMRLCWKYSILANQNKSNVYFLDKFKWSLDSNNLFEINWNWNYILNLHNLMLNIAPINYFNYVDYLNPYNYNNFQYNTFFENFNQSYTLNSPGYNYLNQNQSAINTSLKQANLAIDQSKWGFAKAGFGALLGGIAGGDKGGIAGGGLGALTGGLFGGISSYFGYKRAELQKQMIYSHVEDASRQPDQINSQNFASYDLEFWNNQFSIVDPGISPKAPSIKIESYPIATQIKIAKHFQWFGYSVNQNQNLSGVFNQNNPINDKVYGVRYFYNYWKIQNISTAINQNLPAKFIMDWFNDVFEKGVRIWNIKNLANYNYNFKDFTFENWEVNIFSYLK